MLDRARFSWTTIIMLSLEHQAAMETLVPISGHNADVADLSHTLFVWSFYLWSSLCFVLGAGRTVTRH